MRHLACLSRVPLSMKCTPGYEPHWATKKPKALKPSEVDRETFNYGAAIGAPKGNAEYDAIARYTDGLGGAVMAFSAAHWRLEMAVRDVRTSCSGAERDAAMTELRKVFHAVDRSLEYVDAGPAKYFRYGRIGNVLRTFNPFA